MWQREVITVINSSHSLSMHYALHSVLSIRLISFIPHSKYEISNFSHTYFPGEDNEALRG